MFVKTGVSPWICRAAPSFFLLRRLRGGLEVSTTDTSLGDIAVTSTLFFVFSLAASQTRDMTPTKKTKRQINCIFIVAWFFFNSLR